MLWALLNTRLFAALAVAAIVTMYVRSTKQQQQQQQQQQPSLWQLFAVTFVATYVTLYIAEQLQGSKVTGGGGDSSVKLDDMMQHVDFKLPKF